MTVVATLAADVLASVSPATANTGGNTDEINVIDEGTVIVLESVEILIDRASTSSTAPARSSRK
jgi:hypothetical protein